MGDSVEVRHEIRPPAFPEVPEYLFRESGLGSMYVTGEPVCYVVAREEE